MNGNEANIHDAGFREQAGTGRDAGDPKRAAYGPALIDRPRRSPALAAILSMMPGLGQVYVGYYQQGFLHLAIFAACIMVLSSHNLDALKPPVGVSMAFFILFNMIDANRRAHHYNRVAAGLGAEELPEEFKLPKARGSMFGGVLLIAIGVLFLLDLNFDIPLDWLEDWWPLVLVLIGGRLVWQARRSKAGQN